MKDFLLLVVIGLVLTVLFADGGLELSPTISPAFDAALNVQYSPDRSVTTTTIEQQTNIDTNIEHQMVVLQPPQASNSGVNLIDVGPGRCAVQPGDVVEQEQGNGACFVVNGGQKFFINPNGNRWPVDGGENMLLPLAAPTAAAAAPLQPPAAPPTLDQLQAAFLRNGGELPWLWSLRSDDSKLRWLSERGESWR